MSNMSYCRFRNTKKDLEDCVETLEEIGADLGLPEDKLSKEEQTAMDDMYNLCERYIEEIDTFKEGRRRAAQGE